MTWPIAQRYEMGVDPFAELHRLHREVDQLLGGVAAAPVAGPALNVWASETEATAILAAPDVAAADLSITVEGRVLVVEGERKPEADMAANSARQERATGKFRREVRLPFEVAADQVKARYERGFLTITLPRSEQSKPRRISIQSN